METTIGIEDLPIVEKIVRKAVGSWRADLRYEDAVQEALVRAWKDIQSGEDDYNHVINRAKLWARAWLQKPYSRPTGAPKLSMDGVTTEEAERKRQKIVSYVHEFVKLHERKPTNPEVSKALGIPLATVAQQRINIATGKYDHAVYEAEGSRRRISKSYFTPVHMDAFEAPDKDMMVAGAVFEEQLIAELDFELLLKAVSPESSQILYYYIVMGLNKPESAKAMGMGLKQFNNKLTIALNEAHKVIDPSFEIPAGRYNQSVCPKGHEYTPENTMHEKKTGQRRCRQCQRDYYTARRARIAAERATQPKKPRKQKLKPNCKRGHEIRGIRPGNGKRYCKICNFMNGKGNGQEPGPESKLWEWDTPK